LGIWIGQTESAKYWLGVLNEFKNRGVSDVLIFAVDGLAGFPEAIGAVYPHAEIQRCLVHQVRNSLFHVAWKDRKVVATSLRAVYTAPTEEAGLMALAEFEQAWGRKYPHVVMSWKRKWTELATFFKYPGEVSRLIYTTNPIESLNSRVRKTVKGKSVFPTETALFKALYLAVGEATKRWRVRTLELAGDHAPAVHLLPGQATGVPLLNHQPRWFTQRMDIPPSGLEVMEGSPISQLQEKFKGGVSPWEPGDQGKDQGRCRGGGALCPGLNWAD